LRIRERTSRISCISVVITGLKVTQRGSTSHRVGHDLESSVDLVLLPQLAKDPPNRLHKAWLQCLVPSVKVDPSSHSLDSALPFIGVSHDDSPALGIVFLNTDIHDILLALDAELFVDLVLDRETMRIPSESSLDMVTSSVSMSGHDVLYVS
jgi:hypothetical protein